MISWLTWLGKLVLTLSPMNLVRMAVHKGGLLITGSWAPAIAIAAAVTSVAGYLLWGHHSTIRNEILTRDAHWNGELSRANWEAAKEQDALRREIQRRVDLERQKWQTQLADRTGHIMMLEQEIARLQAAGDDPVISADQARIFRKRSRQ
jgi:hypothetical protein